MTTAQELDKALAKLDAELKLWGIDTYLGFRTEQTLRLSVSGANNLVALVDRLNHEIARLSLIVGDLETGTNNADWFDMTTTITPKG